MWNFVNTLSEGYISLLCWKTLHFFRDIVCHTFWVIIESEIKFSHKMDLNVNKTEVTRVKLELRN